MGDLLRNSRNKLLRRLTAHGSGSIEEPVRSDSSTPASTGTPASPPSKKPVTATPVHRILERPNLEQPKPLPSTTKTAFNPSLAPAVVVQEATPPPVPRVPGPPPKSSSIVRANSPRPGPDRKVAFSGGLTGHIQPGPSTAKTISPPTKKDNSSIHLGAQPQMMTMSRRKVWIKRPGASPTLVQINHDDVVDEVRDMVLRKYANSLGRTFDAPDVTIKIVPRERTQRESERVLNPEESITLILDTYYPGGQGVDEALLVDVSAKRTPKPSPRIVNHMSSYFDDARPAENDGDYFSSMPVASPNANGLIQAAGNRRPSIQHAFHPHSMAILETGLLPALHSPGIRKHRERPSAHHAGDRSRGQQRSMVESVHAPTPPPLPTPPVPDLPKGSSVKASTPPLDRMSSPRPHNKTRMRDRKTSNANERPAIDGRKTSDKQPSYSFLGGIVPPINVLIVEDNPINLRLLEMFAKRLKVRWSTAMDGREAVNKWRKGGFHLVLMDIQLPIMSGLEATKEIRRLERVNGIGVFARSEGEERVGLPKMNNGVDAANEDAIQGTTNGESANGPQEDDKLDGVFKSPVIIVALTASSLQSDRHEALAAGCNDFLTKPVSFVYLESKVMEWGCMQALIDFDGWRKWKDMAAAAEKQQATLQANEDPATRAKREAKEAKKAAMMAKMAQRA